MLEALTQAGAWLIRDMEDFAHSVIILKQARTIKYGSFVETLAGNLSCGWNSPRTMPRIARSRGLE